MTNFLSGIVLLSAAIHYGWSFNLMSGRRAAEYENAICQPLKKHLDLQGCGDCVCKPSGYGSVCENILCSRVFKRPVSQRECVPYESFSTHCHYCKCSAAGVPTNCEEKHRGCMDELIESLQIERVRAPFMRALSRSRRKRFFPRAIEI